ncbi:tetrapyrrole biosynthesis, uroporphyrinogen III synthase [Rhodotorula sp. JG-1b]|nr:tetrapyrrole biosynthesis, uroporphyrinogen III synthase [Rhodotorula sp. JG-1b]
MAEPPKKRQRRHLVLVRTPKHPLEKDPYHLARLAAQRDDTDLELHHLAILETHYCNQDQLRSAVEHVHAAAADADSDPPGWDGVVMTSARSVEAYCAAQRDLVAHSADRPLPAPSIPFFVVGHPTCTALQRAPCPPCQDQVFGAEESGTGERLAEYIVQHFQAESRGAPSDLTRRPRLLYLTGDKNRDTIPRRLAAGQIDFDPLQVYSTTPSPSFATNLDAVLSGVDAASEDEGSDTQVWFALFSPSGAAECLAEMRKRRLIPPSPTSTPSQPTTNGTHALPSESDSPSSAPPHPIYSHLAARIRFAAIGPVTEQFLQEQALPVHAVAEKPEPSALLDAVLRATGMPHS